MLLGILLHAAAGERIPCSFDHPIMLVELRDAMEKGCYLAPGTVLSMSVEDVAGKQVLGFTSGTSNLSEASLASIDLMVQIMKSKPSLNVTVVGHADLSEMGDLQKISEERAKTAIDIMVIGGIDPSRLSYVGKGATQPVDTSRTRAGAAANRRVEFVLTQPVK